MTDTTARPADISSTERVGWIVAVALLAALTVPWFLWGNDALVAGLPLWLWWYIGWMGLTAIVFSLFSRRAWGLGIPGVPDSDVDGGDRP